MKCLSCHCKPLCMTMLQIVLTFCFVKNLTDLLLGKRLLDIPKLMDVCAIYGHDNAKLTQSLVKLLIPCMGIPMLIFGIRYLFGYLRGWQIAL